MVGIVSERRFQGSLERLFSSIIPILVAKGFDRRCALWRGTWSRERGVGFRLQISRMRTDGSAALGRLPPRYRRHCSELDAVVAKSGEHRPLFYRINQGGMEGTKEEKIAFRTPTWWESRTHRRATLCATSLTRHGTVFSFGAAIGCRAGAATCLIGRAENSSTWHKNIFCAASCSARAQRNSTAGGDPAAFGHLAVLRFATVVFGW
jgi:hypothetical protein